MVAILRFVGMASETLAGLVVLLSLGTGSVLADSPIPDYPINCGTACGCVNNTGYPCAPKQKHCDTLCTCDTVYWVCL